MFKKIIVVALVLFSLFPSSPASAQGDAASQIPSLNPFCWRRAECDKMIKQFGTEDNEDAFVTSGVAPCEGGVKGSPEEWGRCLPAGKSVTEISFGGQNKFSHIGEFILLMYKYLVTVASILAVIMIILAGVQWVTSGGNSERISSAKKRIGGAIIGLFIAYMSYFILNTINPALVNLRLPQVWLIKPQHLVPEFCSQIEGADDGMNFMLAAGPTQEEQAKKITLDATLATGEKYIWKNPSTTSKFSCGSRFFVEGGGESSCKGKICDDQKSCFDKTANRKNATCGDIRVGGNISYSSILKGCGNFGQIGSAIAGEGIVAPWHCPPVGNVRLLTVCEKGPVGGALVPEQLRTLFDETLKFGGNNIDNGNYYWIDSKAADVMSDVMSRCRNNGWGEVKGFVVKFDMRNVANDEIHFIGKGGVDLGSANSGIFGWLYRVDKRYLISIDELIEGYHMDVDASDVINTDSVLPRYKTYWEAQYQGQ